MANFLTPYLASALTSERTRDLKRGWKAMNRTLAGGKHVIQFFHRVDDPYSHLVLQTLPQLKRRYHIQIEPLPVFKGNEEFFPHRDRWSDYAVEDAKRLAPFWGLEFPPDAKIANEKLAQLANRILLNVESSEQFLEAAIPLGQAVWSEDIEEILRWETRLGSMLTHHAAEKLKENMKRLLGMGHYLTGMLHYEGEWYWGIDRIDHLEKRLSANPALMKNKDKPRVRPAEVVKHPQSKRIGKDLPLEMYLSFRSPYSYIALARVKKLIEQYPLALEYKPVLPMVMRGLEVPKPKASYFLHDAKREAAKHGVPFGHIYDPLGKGVENCLAVFPFAQREGKALEYMLSAMKAIWSEGVNVASEKGMKQVVERAGLEWETAYGFLANEDWRKLVESNQRDLEALELWGVPAFKIDKYVFWGQDRLTWMEKKIQSELIRFESTSHGVKPTWIE